MVPGHLTQFERARVADPDLYPVYRYLGLIHSAEGRLDSALAAFVELANRQPGDAAAQVSIGIVHSRMGALDAAEEAFKAAVALGGAEGDAALKLGGLYVHQRRLRAWPCRCSKKARSRILTTPSFSRPWATSIDSWACSPRPCRPVRRLSGSIPSGRCGAFTSPRRTSG